MLSGHKHYKKYFILCSTEEMKSQFRNDMRVNKKKKKTNVNGKYSQMTEHKPSWLHWSWWKPAKPALVSRSIRLNQ